MNQVPNVFEKEETGDSIRCSACGMIILVNPLRYPEDTISKKITEHWSKCPEIKEIKNQLNLF